MATYKIEFVMFKNPDPIQACVDKYSSEGWALKSISSFVFNPMNKDQTAIITFEK